MWSFLCDLLHKPEPKPDPYVHAIYESLRKILEEHVRAHEFDLKFGMDRNEASKAYLSGLDFAYRVVRAEIHNADTAIEAELDKRLKDWEKEGAPHAD